MAGIMAVSGSVLVKAGKGVSADLTGAGALGKTADVIINEFIGQAESTVNVITRNNYSDTYAALNSDVQLIFNGIVTDLAAIDCIAYDMSGYTTRTEAEDMINVRRDSALRGLSLLRDKKQQDFIDGA